MKMKTVLGYSTGNQIGARKYTKVSLLRITLVLRHPRRNYHPVAPKDARLIAFAVDLVMVVQCRF